MFCSAQKLAQWRELGGFLLTQRILGFEIAEEPYLDPESLEFFGARLRESSFYLEYGSGGSTVLAARLKKRFVSIETDPYFLAAVRAKIGTLAPDQRLVHSDVGITGPWGRPLSRHHAAIRALRWMNSLEAPLRTIAPDDPPDLVLIDGRFRVATALMCCLHFRTSPGTRIVVDDYDERDGYRAIEEYILPVSTVSRMAIFQPSPAANIDDLRSAIARYSADWR